MSPPLLIRKLYLYAWRIILCGVLVITGMYACMAQTNRIKHLFEKLNTVKHDTDRVNIYYSISRLYWNKNADSALLMAQNTLDLAKKIHF
jgi:ferric iron reductase protein FhuF